MANVMDDLMTVLEYPKLKRMPIVQASTSSVYNGIEKHGGMSYLMYLITTLRQE
jgi:hypothetical protein